MSLYAGVRGYLEKIDISKVRLFEDKLMQDVRLKGDSILSAIRAEKNLSEETEAALKPYLDGFVEEFLDNNK